MTVWKIVKGHSAFECVGCGRRVPFDKDEGAYVSTDESQMVEEGCIQRLEVPPTTKDPHAPAFDFPSPPRAHISLKVGLPGYSSVGAELEDWCHESEDMDVFRSRMVQEAVKFLEAGFEAERRFAQKVQNGGTK